MQAIHPKDRDRIGDRLRDHAKGKWDVEYRVLADGQEIRWIHERGFPIHDAAGHLVMMCGFARDVTERKSREEKCLTSMSEFKSTFEKASVGIALIDNQGHAVQSNATLQALVGYDGEGLRSMPFQALFDPDGASAYLACSRAVASGERDFCQLTQGLIDKNGHAVQANLTVIAIRGATRQPSYVIGLVEPLPDQRSQASQPLPS
jgi:PAS domain S-box-containing protein